MTTRTTARVVIAALAITIAAPDAHAQSTIRHPNPPKYPVEIEPKLNLGPNDTYAYGGSAFGINLRDAFNRYRYRHLKSPLRRSVLSSTALPLPRRLCYALKTIAGSSRVTRMIETTAARVHMTSVSTNMPAIKGRGSRISEPSLWLP